MKELTLVWQRPRNEAWEDGWIEYLFKDIPHKTIENLDHSQFIDNSIIVDAICWAPYHNDYINEMSKRDYNFGIIHLTDESLNDDVSSYNKSKFVLRNFYRNIDYDNVMFFPPGWNTGFTNNLYDKLITQRKYIWSFIGQRWDQNRNIMASIMSSVQNGYLYVATHSGPRLMPSEMGKIYNDSIFVVCPRGAIIVESFRVFEALEAGCIPIVENNDYWKIMYGEDFPAIQINNWQQVPGIIENFLNDEMKLISYQIFCKTWWDSHKYQTKKNIENLVKTTMNLE